MKGTAKRQSSYRFETLNHFVDHTLADLTPAEVRVWVVLYRDTKSDGKARASLDDIARRAGVHRQTAWKAIGALKRRNMLKTIKRGRLNAGPSTYVIAPCPMK